MTDKLTVAALAECAEMLKAKALDPNFLHLELTNEFVTGVKNTATYKRIAKQEGWNE